MLRLVARKHDSKPIGKLLDALARHGAHWHLLAGGLPFLIYLRTLAPTVYGLDSAELTTGAYVLGIVHAPGSPLYLLIGHLFTWLPLGDVGYRVNLMSACAMAVTLSFFYAVCCHLTSRRALSLAATWSLAFTYYVWIAAVAAELYALQGTFVTGLILLALKWRDEMKPHLLYALAFFFGLGLGNHLSLVLLAPGFILWLLTAERRLWQQRWHLPVAAGFGLLGASVYLYLPLRYMSDTPLNYALAWGVDLTTWRGFWWMVTGRMFGSLFFAVPLTQVPAELWTYAGWLWGNFVGLGLLVAVLGIVSDWSKRPQFHSALLLMFLVHLVFYLAYRVGDKELMFLPTYLIAGIWFVLGARCIVDWLTRCTGMPQIDAGVLFVLLLAFGNLVTNFAYVDISEDWSARELGEGVFAGLDAGAVYMGTWGDVPILEYLQIVEGQRSDVTLVNLFFTDREHERKLISEALTAGVPVYTSVPGLMADTFGHDYFDVCDCYRLRYP
jgi:hypothetical protein